MNGVKAFRDQLTSPLETPDSWCQPSVLLWWTWLQGPLGNLGELSGTSGAHERRAPCVGQGPGGLQGKLPWKDLPPRCTDVAQIEGAISCPLEAFGRQGFYKCQFSFDFTRWQQRREN